MMGLPNLFMINWQNQFFFVALIKLERISALISCTIHRSARSSISAEGKTNEQEQNTHTPIFCRAEGRERPAISF
jgi:hypothetical protein